MSISEFSQKTGITRAALYEMFKGERVPRLDTLYEMFKGERVPRLDTIGKLLKELGFSLHVA